MSTDADLYPELDKMLTERMKSPSFEPTAKDWEELHKTLDQIEPAGSKPEAS